MIRGFCHGGDNFVMGGDETSGEIISTRMKKIVIISVINNDNCVRLRACVVINFQELVNGTTILSFFS